MRSIAYFILLVSLFQVRLLQSLLVLQISLHVLYSFIVESALDLSSLADVVVAPEELVNLLDSDAKVLH
jgi:hypothetical protein